MARKTFSRRGAMKTGAAALGIGTGVPVLSGTVAADTETLIVQQYGDVEGKYSIQVDDPNATAVSSTLESDDEVRNGSSSSFCEGTLSSGDEDRFEFDGQVIYASLRGGVDFGISDPEYINRYPTLDVEYNDSNPEVNYFFSVAGSSGGVPLSNTESDDYDGGGYIGNGDSIDSFDLDGDDGDGGVLQGFTVELPSTSYLLQLTQNF